MVDTDMLVVALWPTHVDTSLFVCVNGIQNNNSKTHIVVVISTLPMRRCYRNVYFIRRSRHPLHLPPVTEVNPYNRKTVSLSQRFATKECFSSMCRHLTGVWNWWEFILNVWFSCLIELSAITLICYEGLLVFNVHATELNLMGTHVVLRNLFLSRPWIHEGHRVIPLDCVYTVFLLLAPPQEACRSLCHERPGIFTPLMFAQCYSNICMSVCTWLWMCIDLSASMFIMTRSEEFLSHPCGSMFCSGLQCWHAVFVLPWVQNV